ncbi:MAG: type IV pilus assembly protein PilM [Candidatus Cloacimonadales bacterium]
MSKKTKVRFKESLGIDIGSHSVKVVHLKRLSHGYKLLNYDVRSTIPEGIEYLPNDLRNDRFTPVLGSILKGMKINPKRIKHVVSSIGGDDTSIKQVKTIYLPDDELDSALAFEAKKHIPISGNEMVLDYQVLSIEEKTNNMNIILAASTKNVINSHADILSSVGITPGVIDIDAFGITNAFLLSSYVEEGVYVLVNIGAHRTNIVIYGPKAKFFTRDIAYGGYNFTQDIMRKHNLEFGEAETYKLEQGMSSSSPTGETTISMLDISEKNTEDLITDEIRRSIRFYVKEAGNSDFRKIYLMGGTAKLKGLTAYIESKLSIPVESYNPFSSIEMPDKFKDSQDPQLCLALGLAMRPE